MLILKLTKLLFHLLFLKGIMIFRIAKVKMEKGAIIYSNVFVKYPQHIIVGRNSFINYECILWAAPSSKITIGNDVIFGPRVSVIASNHGLSKEKLIRLNEWVDKDIIIEDDVWVGANVTVLAGVKIGKGAVVAANAVVNKNVEPYTIVGGVPAKEIGIRK